MADPEHRLLEVLKTIVQEQGYENHTVEIKAVSSGGANYTARLFAVTLSAPGKPDLRLFAKVSVLGEKLRSSMTTSMYDIETLFYTKIVPKYGELEKRFSIPEHERLHFAKYYGGSTEYMKEILVLEDLTQQGYSPFDRMKCYDWKYASACLNVLAKLHALSVVYERDYPEDYAKMVKVFFFHLPEQVRAFIEKSAETAVKYTEEKFKERVEKFLQNQVREESLMKYFQPKRTVLLAHGDFRPSNILQTTDENGKLKLVLVDHQLIQRGNPTPDLLFFLISGSDEMFRGQHLHQYFDFYYEEFTKALKSFGIDSNEVYNRKDFDEDVQELLPFGLLLGAYTLPIITVDEAMAVEPDAGFEMEALNMEVSEQFPLRFNGLVRDYERLGILKDI